MSDHRPSVRVFDCLMAKNPRRAFVGYARSLEDAVAARDRKLFELERINEDQLAENGKLLERIAELETNLREAARQHHEIRDELKGRMRELEAEVERLRAANKAAARLLEAEPVRLANRLRDCEAQRDEAVALLREPMTDSATTTGEYGGPGCWFCDTEGGHAEDCRANAFLSKITPSKEAGDA